MAVLNVSFLNSKNRTSGSGDSGIMADKLQIFENELGKDGYLAPGDYDLLINTATKIRNTAGLSSAQRSNYDVKISSYIKAKELSSLQMSDDIEKMNRELDSEAAEDTFVVGNNPEEFLNGRVASLQAKLASLQETISRKENAGDDTTKYLNEYNDTLRQYSDKLGALKEMKNFDNTNPISGYVAYVTTNNSGEIVNIDYDKYGAKNGYAETNGMINGFQVYGKVNSKQDGNNIFLLGDKKFSAVDLLVADSANPGSFKPTKLVADAEKRGPITKGKAGFINLDSANLRVQSYLPEDSWAEGVNGTLYHRRVDGGYTKYINAKKEDLNISNIPILKLPSRLEMNIGSNVSETVDGAETIIPDEGTNFNQQSSLESPTQAASPTSNMQQTQIPNQSNLEELKAGTTYRTPQLPKQSTGTDIFSTAKRTMQSGLDYLRSKFIK